MTNENKRVATTEAECTVLNDGTLRIFVTVYTDLLDTRSTLDFPHEQLRDLYLESKENFYDTKANEFQDKYAALNPDWKNEL